MKKQNMSEIPKARIVKRYTFSPPSKCIQITTLCPYACGEKFHRHGLTEENERKGEVLELSQKNSHCLHKPSKPYIPYYETEEQAKYDFDDYSHVRWNFKK